MKLFKKFLILFLFVLFCAQNVFAAKFSDEMKSFIEVHFPKSNLRFDGLITMPDGTLYLPLYPSLVKKPAKIEVREVISVDKSSKHPEIIILNNDYVFMKVIKNSKGQKSLLYMKNPPLEVKTGLLPQDMLVPSGLVIPDNIKGIIGNLEIPTVEDNGLKIDIKSVVEKKSKHVENSNINILKNKVMYIVTSTSKDLQVMKPSDSTPKYALEQSSIIADVKPTPDNKFLLVTNFDKTTLDVISLADDMKIKTIDLTSEGGEILIDKFKNKAYITSPKASCLYILDIPTMTLTQKVKLKGKCSKFTLADNDRKLFYFDQKTNEIWSVELDNDYLTKYIGSYPNISKIEYANGKVYLISRVAGRLASVDYQTLNLMSEMNVNEKPVDMLVYKNNLYVLSAMDNTLQILDIFKDELINTINLNTQGFSTKIYRIEDSNYAVVTDGVANKYSIINLNTNKIEKVNTADIPITKMVILPEVRKN